MEQKQYLIGINKYHYIGREKAQKAYNKVRQERNKAYENYINAKEKREKIERKINRIQARNRIDEDVPF